MQTLPAAFAAMAEYPQFVVYKLIPSKSRAGKTDKIPVSLLTGNPVNAQDPGEWMTFDLAASCASKKEGHGVGFVFTQKDPLFFLDIDNCLQSDNTWSPLAIDLCTRLAGAAVEISSSRKGLHIFGSLSAMPAHACKNTELGIELYTSGRFVALTGIGATGLSETNCDRPLTFIINEYFPPNGSPTGRNSSWRKRWNELVAAGVRPEWRGTQDDDALVARACKSRSTAGEFGKKASFFDLWTANAEVLASLFPDETREYDPSGADMALALHLAFWTGNDAVRMERLMRRSALNRDKYDAREDYLPLTIQGACGRVTTWLCDKPEPIIADKPAPVNISANTFLTIEHQLQHFAGCVYVTDEHRVLVPGGYLLKPDQFNVVRGGYSFVMDTQNAFVKTDAFKAFTQSQAFRFPKAHSTCFKPDLAPGVIINQDGQDVVNTYWPIVTPRISGDIAIFMTHLKKVIPDDRDREIFLCYLAALIQYPGVKFQWTPVLQGVEGNGKTFFTWCIQMAIGIRYSHFPKASEIAGNFNGWMYGKIFYGVEDIYTAEGRNEILETLKPMITNSYLEIERKGIDKVTREVCGNFLINTNHKDGLRKTENDRRFAPFYTAQQELSDLKRDGMDSEYFATLYAWANKGNGYAMIHDFLACYEIAEEFNPALGGRAPITTSTSLAIEYGRGRIEHEIMELIAQGEVGFRNGWVSSTFLTRALTLIKADRTVPSNKRRDFMNTLGYVLHPGLTEGRVNNPVQPDGTKSRLYIKKTHKHLELRGGAEIAKAYTESQSS